MGDQIAGEGLVPLVVVSSGHIFYSWLFPAARCAQLKLRCLPGLPLTTVSFPRLLALTLPFFSFFAHGFAAVGVVVLLYFLGRLEER